MFFKRVLLSPLVDNLDQAITGVRDDWHRSARARILEEEQFRFIGANTEILSGQLVNLLQNKLKPSPSEKGRKERRNGVRIQGFYRRNFT